jgi:hypothetical protein
MKINLRAKDTDLGWMKRFDRFYLSAAPHWFEWLGWVLILGVLEFLRCKSHSIILTVVLGLSWLFFWRYLVALLDPLEIAGIPWLSSRKAKIIASTLFSGFLAGAVYLVARYMAALASEYTST